jgi:hypothetical protein
MKVETVLYLRLSVIYTFFLLISAMIIFSINSLSDHDTENYRSV